jgi:redox-sensitive bicupin YhaK (pirin superfamily)
LSPYKEDQGVWIHQEAWFHIGEFTGNASTYYPLKKESNGIYAFVLQGNVEIEGQELGSRDGFGIWDTKIIQVKAYSESRVLLMEVPMSL